MSASRKATQRAALAALLLLGAGHSYSAAIDESKAAGVMAAYMRHIAALTTWPGERVADVDQPILFGVVGDDPNGVMNPIRKRIDSNEGLLAQGRKIRVVDLKLPSDAGEDLELVLAPCALLFLSEGAQDEWARIKPAVTSLPIVTVSEMKGFAELGGMIEYFVDLGTGKVRLIVNLRTMRKAGIVLSARLLALEAVIVLGEREEV
jgi:hypothetical protein